MEPLDIYRAADLLVQQHGRDAKARAIRRAAELRAAGDGEGEAVLLRVADAVRDLQRTRPAMEQPLH